MKVNLFGEKTTNIDKLIYCIKVLSIILCLLTAVPVLNEIFRNGFKVLSVVSFFVIVYCFIKNRSFRTKEYLLLFLFCCSYFVTIIINRDTHFINEVAIFALTFMQFFLLTYCEKDRDIEDIKKEIASFGWIIMAIAFVFAIINIALLWMELLGQITITKKSVLYGLVDNRMGGLYNPNVGTVISYVSCLISILFFKDAKEKKIKVILGISIAVEFIAFSACQSRGGYISVFAMIFMIFLFIYRKDKFKGAKKYIARLVTATVMCILVFCAGSISNKIMWNIPNLVIGMEGDEESISAKRKNLDESNIGSASAGRTTLWSVAINALHEENEVFGIGFRSIDDVYAEKLSKHSYLNSAAGGTHNAYITVLVSSGYLGVMLFILFLLLIVAKAIKLLLSKEAPVYVKCISGIMLAFLLGELFESRFIFGMNLIACLSWIFFGYVMYFSEVYKDGKCNNSRI